MKEAMKHEDNYTNTHYKLLPGLIDVFEDLRDPPLILFMNCDLSAKRLLLELN